MREVNRIPKILSKIEKIWLKHPNLRLGQLIVNAINTDYLYEIEDDVLIVLLEKLYERN